MVVGVTLSYAGYALYKHRLYKLAAKSLMLVLGLNLTDGSLTLAARRRLAVSANPAARGY